jgi:hypothetical protein
MRGSAQIRVPLADLLRGEDSEAGAWLVALARDVPAPEGDHGTPYVTITAEWDHVRDEG